MGGRGRRPSGPLLRGSPRGPEGWASELDRREEASRAAGCDRGRWGAVSTLPGRAAGRAGGRSWQGRHGETGIFCSDFGDMWVHLTSCKFAKRLRFHYFSVLLITFVIRQCLDFNT